MDTFSGLMIFIVTIMDLIMSVSAGGMLGAGLGLYKPACADACRQILSSQKLLCGVDPEDSAYQDKRLGPVKNVVNTPECYVQDPAYLKTLALCIADRCSRDNDPPLSVLQGWWETRVTLRPGQFRSTTNIQPNISYQDALRDAQRDVAEVGEANIPFTGMGGPLNVTSLISDQVILPLWNGMKWFERYEVNNTKNG